MEAAAAVVAAVDTIAVGVDCGGGRCSTRFFGTAFDLTAVEVEGAAGLFTGTVELMLF